MVALFILKNNNNKINNKSSSVMNECFAVSHLHLYIYLVIDAYDWAKYQLTRNIDYMYMYIYIYKRNKYLFRYLTHALTLWECITQWLSQVF